MFGLLVFLGIPTYIYMSVAEARDENESMRNALRDIDKAIRLGESPGTEEGHR